MDANMYLVLVLVTFTTFSTHTTKLGEIKCIPNMRTH